MARGQPRGRVQAFTFMIQDDRYAVATVALVMLPDDGQARDIAARRLAESPHHLAVEVFQDDVLLFRVTRDPRL